MRVNKAVKVHHKNRRKLLTLYCDTFSEASIKRVAVGLIYLRVAPELCPKRFLDVFRSRKICIWVVIFLLILVFETQLPANMANVVYTSLCSRQIQLRIRCVTNCCGFHRLILRFWEIEKASKFKKKMAFHENILMIIFQFQQFTLKQHTYHKNNGNFHDFDLDNAVREGSIFLYPMRCRITIAVRVGMRGKFTRGK